MKVFFMNNTFLAKSFIIFFLGTSVAAQAGFDDLEDSDPVACNIVKLSHRDTPSGSLNIMKKSNKISLSEVRVTTGLYLEELQEHISSKDSLSKLAKYILNIMPQQTYELEKLSKSRDNHQYGLHIEGALLHKNSQPSDVHIRIIEVEDTAGAFFRLLVEDPRISYCFNSSISTGTDCISILFKIPSKTN